MFSALSFFFVWGKKNEIYNELRKAIRLGFLYFFSLVMCVFPTTFRKRETNKPSSSTSISGNNRK